MKVHTKAPEVKRVLAKAKQLIADPERWTRGALAQDKLGFFVSPRDPDACCWCAQGAVYALTTIELAHLAIWSLREAAGESPIEEINDDEGHAAVMALFDRAIETAEGAAGL